MAVILQTYTPAADGFGSGTYAPTFSSYRSAILTLERSLFAGDNLRISSKRSSMDTNIHKYRLVRLYADSTKIFDGFIKFPEYVFKSNGKNNFEATAVSWDKELSEITLGASDGASYTAKTINYMFGDLCRIANNYGITKKAIYAYDSTKIPSMHYDATMFATNIYTRDFTGKTIWTAFQELTQVLDASDNAHIGDWAIKVDALQSEFYIYIIPQMANTDQIMSKAYRNGHLVANKSLSKDYTRLINYCEVYGSGNVRSYTLRTVTGQEATTQILIETAIATNQEYFYATNQPALRRYLRIKIDNPTGGTKTGNVLISGGDGGSPPAELNERFFLEVPAGSVRYHFTNKRYATLSGGAVYAFEVNSFTGCKITVDECTFAVAGKSINDFGTKAKAVLKSDIVNSDDADRYAIRQVRVYHAPIVKTSFQLLPAYVDFTDLIGKTVNAYDEFNAAATDYFCIQQRYVFRGKVKREYLTLQRYNYDYEYID